MTDAITYRNTKTTLPGWVPTVHVEQDRGLAYEADSHFVHFYGRSSGFWMVSTGLTATERKDGSLSDWAVRRFGADKIEEVKAPVGSVVEGVWRPALYYEADILQALGHSESEQRGAAQSLRLLVEKLDELLLYIEPDDNGLKTYSHKTRELLILSCTEVENTWKHYMRLAGAIPVGGRNFTTRDYTKLNGPLFLAEYEVSLRPYGNVPSMRPFFGWNDSAPTRSLPWYDAYNQTKHDRDKHFADATLHHCLSAVAANLVLFCVRFGPFSLLDTPGTLSSIVNHLFDLKLVDCSSSSFYVPLVSLPPNILDGFVCGESKDWIQTWNSAQLRL